MILMGRYPQETCRNMVSFQALVRRQQKSFGMIQSEKQKKIMLIPYWHI